MQSRSRDLETTKCKHPAKNVFAPARAGSGAGLPPYPTPKTSVYTPACSAPVT